MYIKNAPNQCLGFALVDSSGVAITGATVTARRCVDGASQATVTGTVSDKGNGQYCFDMSQADTDGYCITYLFTASSAVPVEKTICTSQAATGVHFTDPRQFLKILASDSRLTNVDSSSSCATANTASFFTEQASRGIADNTNWTANTYKTLLSIPSGIGLVSNIVGPYGLAGTPTTTFEITVDGVLTEVAMTAGGNGYRAVLGPLMNNDANVGEYYTTAFYGVKTFGAITANKDKLLCDGGGNSGGAMPHWGHIGLFGTPCLIFRKSLLIRAKSSENNSSTNLAQRQAAVQYLNLTST